MVAFLLLQDYTLTVVVSSLSGADQLLSTVNAFDTAQWYVHVVLGVGIAWLTAWLTLRGRKDAANVTFIILSMYAAMMIITFIALGGETSQVGKRLAPANGPLDPIRPLLTPEPCLTFVVFCA